MDIGIGLPNPVPGTPGTRLVAWAKRAEEAGFSGLATIDRIAYPSYESMVTLAAAAGATQRIGLLTNVLLEPTRNPVLLAKHAASLDQLSGGRFTLGLGVGGRQDDFEAVGLSFQDRGKRLDEDLELMHRVWKGELVNGALKPIGPTPVNGAVPILVGGSTEKAIERTVNWGIGWTVGGAPPEQGGPFADRIRKAWADAGREGQPKIVGLTYFGLGEGALEKATAYLGDYYGDFGSQIAQWIPKTPEALRDTIRKFEDFGFDELFLDPTSAELDQIDQAAEAAL
jgi:alkanesulfonate monooxygenase SsuD/methylene tetrahydromethanopterin reductase-like flavin-dependent oxidoreductase (luciferase family)